MLAVRRGFLAGLRTLGIASAVTFVLVVALLFGKYVSKIVASDGREVFLLKLLGIAISGSTAHNATKILEPLRDLFAAMFFVLFGLTIDPAGIPPVLGRAVLLAIVTTEVNQRPVQPASTSAMRVAEPCEPV